jgi:hypothetical protein
MSTGMDVLPLLPSFRQGCWIAAVGSLIYALARVIHNVFLHPLSRFPGPPGAACTKLWLAYMIFIRRVSLPTLREELHQKYGMFSIGTLLLLSTDVGQVTLYGSPRMR